MQPAFVFCEHLTDLAGLLEGWLQWTAGELGSLEGQTPQPGAAGAGPCAAALSSPQRPLPSWSTTHQSEGSFSVQDPQDNYNIHKHNDTSDDDHDDDNDDQSISYQQQS